MEFARENMHLAGPGEAVLQLAPAGVEDHLRLDGHLQMPSGMAQLRWHKYRTSVIDSKAADARMAQG